MFSNKLRLLLLLIIIFIRYTKSDDVGGEDYFDDAEHSEFEDCEYEIDFKTYKRLQKLELCDVLKSPSSQSAIQLNMYVNHTEDKIHLRASSLPSTSTNLNRSLITLTTDLIDDFTNPASLLKIDNYQLISFSTLQSMLLSLINVDLKLLGKNLKKTLILSKGGQKTMLSCSGTVYPKQDLKMLNITPAFTKAITCIKEPQQDRFFTLQEKIYLYRDNEKSFKMNDIHRDDQKKISRTTWYICNNPTACVNGVQNIKVLDKTVNYVLKFLQKTPAG